MMDMLVSVYFNVFPKTSNYYFIRISKTKMVSWPSIGFPIFNFRNCCTMCKHRLNLC
ncbi:hypothetical protein RDI58_021708 [Solanum bulbocastanum]|uniref:Uncharacterized protein n=1 Tax=Solanum bulbocastanum TaxID=147425 RepID=A0AAN8T4H4_SOLBU